MKSWNKQGDRIIGRRRESFMRKMCWIFIAILGMVLGICGCGSSYDSETQSDVQTETEETGATEETSDDASDDESEDMVFVLRQAERTGGVKLAFEQGEGNTMEYERNEYGLYTAIKVFDDNGIELGDTAEITDEYDEQGRLTSYNTGYRIFEFMYDTDGNMEQISVSDENNIRLCLVYYSDQEGSTYSCSEFDDSKITVMRFDADMNLIYKVIEKGEDTIYETNNTYDDDGLLISEDYVKGGHEYIKNYEYNESGWLVKKTGYLDGELEFVDEYTYDSNGNILTLIGNAYIDTTSSMIPISLPDGEEYLHEEYSSEDYDEQGRCLYYYEDGVKKESTEKWNYEYSDDGWLLRETDLNNNISRTFDKDGNIVETEEKELDYTVIKKQYPVMNDELLLVFYAICGDDYV
jgi:YD repeat-containing protein